MRIFEVLLIGVNLLALLWPLLSGRMRRQGMILVPSGIFLLLNAHIAIEGYRWQMLPAYLSSVVVFVGGLLGFWFFRPVPGARRRWILAVLGSCLGLLLLSAATVASALVPVFEFPRHQGPYPVGRRSLPVVVGADPWLNLWYPSVAETGEPAAYQLESSRPASPNASVSSFFLGHLELLRSRSVESAKIRADQGPLPLLVFFQDRTIPLGWSSYLCEELASQGFVVLGIDQAPESGMGTQILSFALRELRSQPEAQLLQLERFGIFGHRLGAAAASQASSLPGVAAALFLAPKGKIVVSAEQPSMVMAESDNATEIPDGLSHSLRIEDFEAFDFTDLAFCTPLEIEGLRGSLTGERCARITAAYALAFFTKNLLGKDVKLLDGPSPDYPEVEFR